MDRDSLAVMSRVRTSVFASAAASAAALAIAFVSANCTYGVYDGNVVRSSRALSPPPLCADEAGKQTFTTSGSFTPPPGIERVSVSLVGGGGGGGGSNCGGSFGGGGGGGAGQAKLAVAVPVSGPVNVVVGAPGTAGVCSTWHKANVDPSKEPNGGEGGTSSFGSLTAAGGKGGAGGGQYEGGAGGASGGGTPGGNAVMSAPGTNGGTDTDGQSGGGGGGGGYNLPPSPGFAGGNGGGSGATAGGSGSQYRTNANGRMAGGGGGGSSPFGIGGTACSYQVPGTDGQGPGAGGGACMAGAPGLVVVEYGDASAASCGLSCTGTDGRKYGPCAAGSCTTTPSGDCSPPSAGGVYCCAPNDAGIEVGETTFEPGRQASIRTTDGAFTITFPVDAFAQRAKIVVRRFGDRTIRNLQVPVYGVTSEVPLAMGARVLVSFFGNEGGNPGGSSGGSSHLVVTVEPPNGGVRPTALGLKTGNSPTTVAGITSTLGVFSLDVVSAPTIALSTGAGASCFERCCAGPNASNSSAAAFFFAGTCHCQASTSGGPDERAGDCLLACPDVAQTIAKCEELSASTATSLSCIGPNAGGPNTCMPQMNGPTSVPPLCCISRTQTQCANGTCQGFSDAVLKVSCGSQDDCKKPFVCCYDPTDSSTSCKRDCPAARRICKQSSDCPDAGDAGATCPSSRCSFSTCGSPIPPQCQ